MFEVGGCVRDRLLGLKAKDVDFVVIAPSFSAMRDHIENILGLRIFLESPEHLTIRAGVPKGHPLRERCKDADFVLARKDGPSFDGRHPEFVEPGTLEDDLKRRDFTVNAMAQDPFTGEIIDPHGGQADLEARVLRFVGNAFDRIEEDGLRVLRALRFSITKGLEIQTSHRLALVSKLAETRLASVSVERIQGELEKMFRHDTLATLRLLNELPEGMQEAIFRGGLWLLPTLKKRR
jgi:tRNA nucleotidyltransferase (CCA-adding enzyme)